LARFDGSSTSPEKLEILFHEAVQWLEDMKNAGPSQHAGFLIWARRSPEHLNAFLTMLETRPALRKLGPDLLLEAAKEAELEGKSSASKWDLKNHPLVVLTSAVIAAGGITWEVVDTLMVRPQTQQIELLKADVAALQKQVASGRRGREASGRSKAAVTSEKLDERGPVRQ
jgi:hypothetical protein